MRTRVVIVASGGANVASLQFALQRLSVDSHVSDDAREIETASHVILPGVGAAADAMRRLRLASLDRIIPGLTQPVLGVCLGMQILLEASEEGSTSCLGIIPGRAVRFEAAPGRPVPHMGWNTVDVDRPSPLLAGIPSSAYVYFLHSYALPRGAATVASCRYGQAFSACIAWRNFYGAQFHPEKSASTGARLLKNFLELA